MGSSEVVEQILQNKLSTAILLLTEERQRVNTREVKRGPHRDREQRERLREIATLQIALTTLTRPSEECGEGSGQPRQTGDRSRRKMQFSVATCPFCT